MWGGILAGILAAGGIVFLAADRWVDLGDWFVVITGVGSILTIIQNPEGLAAGGHALAARHPAPAVRPQAASAEAPVAEPPSRVAGRPRTARRRAGARRSATSTSATAASWRSTTCHCACGRAPSSGLIGPNGAGKTSVIDAITGFARADRRHRGRRGLASAGLAPHQRVKRGLVRTFQAIELYDDLSVEENVSVAAFAATLNERSEAVEPGARRWSASRTSATDRPAT